MSYKVDNPSLQGITQRKSFVSKLKLSQYDIALIVPG